METWCGRLTKNSRETVQKKTYSRRISNDSSADVYKFTKLWFTLMNGKFVHPRESGEANGSPQQRITFEWLRSTAKFELCTSAVKISDRLRSLSHFKRIASVDCRYLTGDTFATQRRRPKPRKSTGNRRFFSHVPPTVPHTNGKRYRVASSRNSHSRGTLKSRRSGQSTIQPERFARVHRSSRRNRWSSSPQKPWTASYLGS